MDINNSNYLKIGDIFEIKKGMTIETSIPEKFIFPNSFLSKKNCMYSITIGDILKIPEFDPKIIRKKLTNDIQNLIEVSTGKYISLIDIDNFVVPKIFKKINKKTSTQIFDTNLYKGKYIVTKTKFDEIGFNIIAYKLNKLNNKKIDKKFKIDFYESIDSNLPKYIVNSIKNYIENEKIIIFKNVNIKKYIENY